MKSSVPCRQCLCGERSFCCPGERLPRQDFLPARFHCHLYRIEINVQPISSHCAEGYVCNGRNGNTIRTGVHPTEWFCQEFGVATPESTFLIPGIIVGFVLFLLFLIYKVKYLSTLYGIPNFSLLKISCFADACGQIGYGRGGDCYQWKKRGSVHPMQMNFGPHGEFLGPAVPVQPAAVLTVKSKSTLTSLFAKKK